MSVSWYSLEMASSRTIDTVPRLRGGAGLVAFAAAAEGYADDLADAGFLHGDAVHDVGLFHGALLVGDDDELGVVAHLGDEAGEAAYVGFVERGVDLVEDAEGCGLELEGADQER